jgi:predicted transcriptional regulator
MIYDFYHDAGHGWLEVPYQDMLNVGVTLEDVSSCSYATVINYKPTVYLEEDLDVAVFMLAAKRAGKEIKFRHIDVDGDSVIRSYPANSKGRDFDMSDMRSLMQACEQEGVFA